MKKNISKKNGTESPLQPVNHSERRKWKRYIHLRELGVSTNCCAIQSRLHWGYSFIYNIILYGCIWLKLREKFARGVALVMTITGMQTAMVANDEQPAIGDGNWDDETETITSIYG